MVQPLSIERYSPQHRKSKGDHRALVLFMDENGDCAPDASSLLSQDILARIKQSSAPSDKLFSFMDIFIQEMKGFQRVILFRLGVLKDIKNDGWIRVGGALERALRTTEEATLFWAAPGVHLERHHLVDVLVGMHLARYKFDRYLTQNSKKEAQTENRLHQLTIMCDATEYLEASIKEAAFIAESVCLARDLVNEPPNILTPVEFCNRVEGLTALGLEVRILDAQALEQIGMGALLAVARGSSKTPRVAILQWKGAAGSDPCLAFVGKGVVFDSGGISLKPSAGMEDMKGDMAGAAAVVGLLKLVAHRQLKRNIVGVVGLVENMPDGDALRPGDIVTTLSGQTIEVVNTDAEGRLVLADLLHYTQETFSPGGIINLATLTGAITVALGRERAGLFSNNDALANALLEAGIHTGEGLWRMPLGEEYDKLLKSRFADIRNSCGRSAGAITAAQFLKRFVKNSCWAHLDIAGTAMDSLKTPYNHSWANGFGVRLLDRFLRIWHAS